MYGLLVKRQAVLLKSPTLEVGVPDPLGQGNHYALKASVIENLGQLGVWR